MYVSKIHTAVVQDRSLKDIVIQHALPHSCYFIVMPHIITFFSYTEDVQMSVKTR